MAVKSKFYLEIYNEKNAVIGVVPLDTYPNEETIDKVIRETCQKVDGHENNLSGKTAKVDKRFSVIE
ncbi:hypothetical protein [Tumebacillus permanentifrigoris]|uniref:Uncharacterized protein n=1 Tax=Tumebacillus permanentifrigoris TaxID=378543 RepID=A0A316DCC5_9BACL|nr:hypothetical protein [Tumebacillus permanentifrigoris]PWK15605.1 hypothetical protein C7459_103145 [Tumebacillus permanentifrigoris]